METASMDCMGAGPSAQPKITEMSEVQENKSPQDTNAVDLNITIAKIRTSLQASNRASSGGLDTPSGADLPPGSPRSVPSSARRDTAIDRELDLKLALGGLSGNPFKTLLDQPKAAAEVIVNSLRTSMQLHLEAFLGTDWREVMLTVMPWKCIHLRAATHASVLPPQVKSSIILGKAGGRTNNSDHAVRNLACEC